MPNGNNYRSTSRSVNVSIGTSNYGRGTIDRRDRRPQTKAIRGVEALAANRRETEKKRKMAEEHLDRDSKRTLKAIRQGGSPEGYNGDAGDGYCDDDQGEEGVNMSDRMTAVELANAVDAAVVDPKHYKDGRTWRNRRTRFDAQWDAHLDGMADAYLRRRYPSPSTPGADEISSDKPARPASDLDIKIAVVDLYTLTTEAVIPRRDDQVTAVALVDAGYLGNSPVTPSIAISLKTLDLFKILRQRKASFSTEAFAKVLCDLYQVPFSRQWRTALADAFDVFLTIKRKVDEKVQAALGRATANWRVLNACPPCTYELEAEADLLFRILMSLDGNNSAKRVDTGFRQAGDIRQFSSSYWIDEGEVDKFKLEDIRVKGPEVPSEPLFEEDEKDEGDEGVASSQEVEASECVRNWKAAQSDSKKRVMEMFDESGWFTAGCRHGLTFWVADMVRTGEQAKYPLSIINRALDVLGGKLLIGYDIGCAFESTIKSTTLGQRFVESGSRCCVNAYHGYAHNYACQVQNHPNNIEGAGIEDFETQERLYSASNTTASVIRYASKYRRRNFLDLFLQQYDRDKYANLGLMIRNNYQQAIDIIDEGTPLLDRLLESCNASRDDLDIWQGDQARYFATLGKEPDQDIHRVAYVELLQELRAAEQAAASKSANFLNALPEEWDPSGGGNTYYGELSRTRRLETMRKYARDKVERVSKEVIAMELKLGITTRWDPTMTEYLETLQYMNKRKFHKALDDLQKLVVQRLFELHRLGLSGIGYRARTLLAKALRTRSKAIQNAVTRYNSAARELDPPGPELDWTKIAKYNFVEEFTVLRNTRRDIQTERWSDGEVREAMKLHQRIKRAQEEIGRLNIEMKRLFTSIHDEHLLFARVQRELEDSKQHQLLGALKDFATHRRRVNRVILRYLREIQGFEGYTGDKNLLGVRRGTACEAEGMQPVEEDDVGTVYVDASDSDSEGEGDEEVVQRGGVIDFISEVAIS
ncbi:hypothetical protein NMY22_g14574 [Coprinellus aureogranulatus]|nr:hypothetical protein NMY22_g14574 [Coprinellus aureogranulatus]